MRRFRVAVALRLIAAVASGAIGSGICGAACIPGGGPQLQSQLDAEAPPPTSLGDDDGGAGPADVDLGDPFAIIGLVPSHGPWTGGTRAKLTGRGFPSKLRVWIGDTELDASAIFASDPTRAAIETPPGKPGPADVRIRDDATAKERTLAAGFLYDAFVLQPDSGATSGGTRVSLVGSGTAWKAGTAIAIGGVACNDVAIADATHMQCTTPPGAPGTKDVTVTTPDGALAQARDAFTYSDSPDGYRGGLTGGALAGSMRVLAFDAWTGMAIAGAQVIAGSSLADAVTKTTDSSGLALLTDVKLTSKITVTVAAKCHQPTTFVNVPVDTVTAYLTPTLDLACASGDPPSTGGHGGISGGEIDGELVFPGVEFKPGDWTVPLPTRATERRAAYVFTAAGSPLGSFYLPDKDTAVTPDSTGSHGYAYTLITAPGNVTLYALAGIEDRSLVPARFVPYVMGVARGVSVQPNTKTPNADIPMTTLLDHTLTLAPAPPPIGARGPDRFQSQIALTLGQSGFAILPMATQTSLLPMSGTMAFVGVPALDGTLTGEAYSIGATAATGTNLGVPASVIARVRATDTSAPLTVGGFLPVPTLVEPSQGAWGGLHVSFEASGAIDLVELTVTSGGGLVTWTIVAPGDTRSFDVPDLGALPNNVGLVHGAISTMIYVARLDGLTYGTLRYGQLDSGSWNAYALDTIHGVY